MTVDIASGTIKRSVKSICFLSLVLEDTDLQAYFLSKKCKYKGVARCWDLSISFCFNLIVSVTNFLRCQNSSLLVEKWVQPKRQGYLDTGIVMIVLFAGVTSILWWHEVRRLSGCFYQASKEEFAINRWDSWNLVQVTYHMKNS